ncbi:PREDICTED: vesicle-associated membrane protein-associated protein A [Propithecus coquereli]|uniref:vesicle-associated membrane protein-associated protein A n=1 Tax=Propithecus coquereli TaxID=379532 RepID=UPI00063FAF7C|nr:PREDICTED: vesicle-associated membrane protein-associated protein A [Propithecus coquereli]
MASAAGAMAKHEQILVLDPPTDLKFKGIWSAGGAEKPTECLVVTYPVMLAEPQARAGWRAMRQPRHGRQCIFSYLVMLQPFDYDPNEKSKHKFMVQTIFAPPNTSDMEAVWKEAKPDELMDSKLRCVFEMPNENDKLGITPPGIAPTATAMSSINNTIATSANYHTKNDPRGLSVFKQEKQKNDMEPSKAVPLNASKQDGPMPKPHSVSLNDTETRKLMEECKRLQGEMMKLSEENRHLRDEGLRLRKVAHSDKPGSTSAASFRDNVTSPLPSLLVVIAAIFIGFFLGKFIL